MLGRCRPCPGWNLQGPECRLVLRIARSAPTARSSAGPTAPSRRCQAACSPPSRLGPNTRARSGTPDAVVCWGANQYGQASPPDGSFTSRRGRDRSLVRYPRRWHARVLGRRPLPESTPPSGTFTAVDAGKYFACAIRDHDKGVACWGQTVLVRPSRGRQPGSRRFRPSAPPRRSDCAGARRHWLI